MTRKKICTLIVAIFLSIYACSVYSSSLTIGFDGLPDLSLDVDEYGVSFSGAVVLACGGALNCGSFPPYSGDNVIYDGPGSGGVIKASFDNKITGKVSVVSGRVTGNTSITLTAYSEDNAILGAVSTGGPNYIGSGSGISENKLLEVKSVDIPISYVTFSDSGNTFTVDDFSFTGSQRKVVIDPGHGKIDGKYQRELSPIYKIVEDKLTLSISNYLKEYLETEGVEIILTRTGENAPFASPGCRPPCWPDLRARVRLAEKQEPDLFVSVHTNGFHDPKVNGTETFYNKFSTHPDDSKILSQKINTSLVELGLRNRGVKNARYEVLKIDTVSALTEIAFHSNSVLDTEKGQTITDEERLSQEAFLKSSAISVGNGIIEFFETMETR